VDNRLPTRTARRTFDGRDEVAVSGDSSRPRKRTRCEESGHARSPSLAREHDEAAGHEKRASHACENADQRVAPVEAVGARSADRGRERAGAARAVAVVGMCGCRSRGRVECAGPAHPGLVVGSDGARPCDRRRPGTAHGPVVRVTRRRGLEGRDPTGASLACAVVGALGQGDRREDACAEHHGGEDVRANLHDVLPPRLDRPLRSHEHRIGGFGWRGPNTG